LSIFEKVQQSLYLSQQPLFANATKLYQRQDTLHTLT